MRQYPHQFDRAHEVVVASRAPTGRLSLGALGLVGAISAGFWMSLAHAFALL